MVMRVGVMAWLVVWVLAIGLVVGGLLYYPWLADDEFGLARSLVLRVSTMVVGFLFLTVGVICFDVLTPGDWLDGIRESPMGEAVVVATLILSMALVFIYS